MRGQLEHQSHTHTAALQLDEAAQRCEEAARYLSMAPPVARAWVEQMVNGVRTAEPASDSTARRPDESGGSPPHAESRRDDNQAEPGAKKSGTATRQDETRPEDGLVGREPEQFRPKASEILKRLPVRSRREKTRGVWVDADGHEHDLISGVDDYTADAERFMNEHNIQIAPGDVTLGSHLEVKFAMFMRERGLTDEIITINNWPCPGARTAATRTPSGSCPTVPGGQCSGQQASSERIYDRTRTPDHDLHHRGLLPTRTQPQPSDLTSNEDVDQLIDALLGETFDHTMAELCIRERSKTEQGLPDHNFRIGIDPDRKLGGIG